jgi:uncharacterized membrane protein (DUF485 family)
MDKKKMASWIAALILLVLCILCIVLIANKSSYVQNNVEKNNVDGSQ